jgi:hypothetical protein
MRSVISRCPVCGEEMTVSCLECHGCGSELRGQFALGSLYRLNPEQTRFVEALLKNRANVLKAAEELSMPYAAARGKLEEVMTALGFAVTPEEVLAPERRREILDQLAQGKLTADEAAKQLKGK